jgi:hypothetical protein
MNYKEVDVQGLMLTTIGCNDNKENYCVTTINRLLRNHYGVLPYVVLHIWELLLRNEINPNTRLKHVLWMFYYFKTYGEYEQTSVKLNVSKTTLWSWIWYVAKDISELEIVCKTNIKKNM